MLISHDEILQDRFVRHGGGTIDFVHCVKYLIKSGGENICPAEIEQVLLRNRRVANAVVVRRADPELGKVPMAFAAHRDDSETEAAQTRKLKPAQKNTGNARMTLHRRTLIATGAAASVTPGRRARAQANTIRIGLLTDFSGPYRDINGPTSVACAKQAIAEFTASNPGIAVELISADHQNKTDTGTTILRSWFDREGVDMALNITNSAVALACNTIVAEKDKVCVNTSAGTSVLTGTACTPNTVQWTYDTWNLAHSTATQVVKAGGDKWFFVTPNYAYGKALQADATKFVEAANGKVLGNATYPFPETTDFSSFIVQAAASGANAIGFAVGGIDLVNFMKQAQEFGLMQKAHMAGMTGFITDVLAMGPAVAQGLTLTENFYWDLNDRTASVLQQSQIETGCQRVSMFHPCRRLRWHMALPESRKGTGRRARQSLRT